MFDKPIGGFQIQQVRLADMLTEIVKAQLVSLHLGRLKDAGTFTPQQVSLAKRNNVNMATDIAREARRLLGANGILAEYCVDAAHGEPRERVHVRGHARRPHADPRPGRHGDQRLQMTPTRRAVGCDGSSSRGRRDVCRDGRRSPRGAAADAAAALVCPALACSLPRGG